MADTQVRMRSDLHEQMKSIAKKNNVNIREVYEEAISRYIREEAEV